MQIARHCRSKLFPTSETHYAVTLVNFHEYFFLGGNGKAESLHPRAEGIPLPRSISRTTIKRGEPIHIPRVTTAS